jgi:hypothetical protein
VGSAANFRSSSSISTSQTSQQEGTSTIIEIAKYDGTDPTFEESTIPNNSVLDWMKADLRKGGDGQEATAYAKILIVVDKNNITSESEIGWDVSGDLLPDVLKAAQIDIDLLLELKHIGLGSYTIRRCSPKSTTSHLCFYSRVAISGHRAAWSFVPKQHCTRAIIVLVPGSDYSLSMQLRSKSESLAHSLFLSAALRGVMLLSGQRYVASSNETLDKVEKDIGYYAFPSSAIASEEVDLAECSKVVGAELTKLGLHIIRLAFQSDIHDQLSQEVAFRWAALFPDDEQKAYQNLCEIILRSDDITAQRFRALKADLVYRQERAKTLLTVVCKQTFRLS